MTAPFKPEAETLISGKVDHTFSAKALPLFGEPFDLDVTNVRIGFDEGWVPHIQADITCALPDADKLALLDARVGCRVQVTLGYRYGKDHEESHVVADLHLRSRSIRHGTAEMTLNLASDEDLLRDHITLGDEEVSRNGINDFVFDVLTMTDPPYSAFIRSDFENGELAEALAGDPAEANKESTELAPVLGKTAWTLIEEAQRRTGAWVYCRNGRDWTIAKRAEVTDSPAHRLSIGQNGTILEGDSVLGRDGFYNEVFLRYEWTEFMLPYYQIGQARISGGPLSIYSVGRQTYVETIDRKVNQAEADAAALDKLSRALTKGYEFTVRAVAAYWLRAGDTVSLTMDGITENLLVKSVNFDPADGTMAVVLRKPEHATLTNEA